MAHARVAFFVLPLLGVFLVSQSTPAGLGLLTVDARDSAVEYNVQAAELTDLRCELTLLGGAVLFGRT